MEGTSNRSKINGTRARAMQPGIPYPVFVAMVLLNIAGNILCCLVIIKTKSLHNFCNFLLVNLAVSDMLAGMIEFFVFTLYLDIGVGKAKLDKVHLFVYPMIEVSILTITVISFERFLAITKPFKVMRKGRVKNLKFIIPCLWILGFILTLPVFIVMYDKTETELSRLKGTTELALDGIVHFISAYLAPSILLAFTYFRMLFVLKRRIQPFRPQRSHVASRANHRVSRLLGAVIISHNICFLPFAIVSFIMTLPFGYDITSSSNEKAFYATYYLQFLSPCLNPFIYFAHSKAFRDACKAVLCRPIKNKP